MSVLPHSFQNLPVYIYRQNGQLWQHIFASTFYWDTVYMDFKVGPWGLGEICEKGHNVNIENCAF